MKMTVRFSYNRSMYLISSRLGRWQRRECYVDSGGQEAQ